MLDGHYKGVSDRFWDRIAAPIARTGVSPNQITLLGTALVIGSAAVYGAHRVPWLLGLTVGLFELLDNLDGAVARLTGRTTRFGAYLDAVTDRYKEAAVFAAIGFVHGQWPLALACITGSLFTSYAKARAGMEAPIDNAPWPDLFERFERIAALCTGLILSAPWPVVLGVDLIVATLALVAFMSHVSALQRVLRARAILSKHDAAR
jgi:phosphatidylglycerophosphate synthase